MNSDDTQDPNREPGDPLIDFSAANLSQWLEQRGQCVVGDGMSEVFSTPTPSQAIQYERIVGICQRLQESPWLIERIENLLGIHSMSSSNRERIGVIAVQLSGRPFLIENAEHLIAMGS